MVLTINSINWLNSVGRRNLFFVWYELNFYTVFRRQSLFKWLIEHDTKKTCDEVTHNSSIHNHGRPTEWKGKWSVSHPSSFAPNKGRTR
jgi:hypothetical protein